MSPIGPAQAGLLVLCFILYTVLSRAWRNRQFKKFAAANGCEAPYDHSANSLFPALDDLKLIIRVINMARTGEDILDDILAERFEHVNTAQQMGVDGALTLETLEPANLQAILATQFKDFEIGKQRINQFFPLLGNSIFSSDGSSWEHARALFRPQFNREAINDLEETEDASQALIEAIGPVDHNGWTKGTELQPLLYNFTLDTATSFLFGESVGSQRMAMGGSNTQDTAEQVRANKQFMADIELVSIYVMDRVRYSSFYWLSDSFKFRQATRRIRSFTEQFVRRALNPPPSHTSRTKKYNLLSALATETQDIYDLRNQTLAILVAGRDTTAGLLGWCFTRLALHPHIFTKLRAIILHDFPPHQNNQITFPSLKACRYLQHFLSETLRLHPTVPVNNRRAARNTTLPLGGGPHQTSPVAISAGQSVVFSVYLMHRRKDLWGEDALEFRPERWEERKVPAWQFLPFSGGPRICLGQQFALTEASYVLVRMLQTFDAIEAVDVGEMRKLKKGLGLTMWPEGMARVRLHKAGAAAM